VTLSELRALSESSVHELEAQLQTIGIDRLAIVGVGNPLKGDDFAGSFVAKKLMSRLPKNARRPLILDAESSPENFTGRIRVFRPKTVIFIDSAIMRSSPSTIRLIDLQETDYPYFSTHNLPLRLLGSLMAGVERLFLLGIEPKSTMFGDEMSSEVRRACDSVVDAVCAIVGKELGVQS